MSPAPLRTPHSTLLAAALGCSALAASFLTGCGSSGGSGTTPPALTGNTSLTVLAASTANDEFAALSLDITGITLTSQSGASVDVLNTPRTIEFMHLNSGVEPIATISIPQGIYTAATISVADGVPECAAYDPTQNMLNTYGISSAAASHVTANLPGPITITGSGMGLELNLQVSQSTNYSSCPGITNGSVPFLLTPTFNVTPIVYTSNPTNITNGLALDLRGLIQTISSNGSFTVAGDFGPNVNGSVWQVDPNPAVALQGITSASQLAAGMVVDMDASIQSDGSLLPSRIAVFDNNPSNLSFTAGPLTGAEAEQDLNQFGLQAQGPAFPAIINAMVPFNFSNAAFHTSQQLTDASSLPFTPSFTAANMVVGQTVLVTTHAASPNGIIPATTVTLVPQTINGNITATSTSGGFTVYTVSLAPYDIFPNLGVQPNQDSPLQSPGTITVYAGSNTTMLSANPPGVGNVARFTGLIFNDSGVLRMDCSQIANGLPE
jgi:hypothetical protein